MPEDLVPIRRALISVSDKSGLAELAGALVGRGVELVSTGGTAQALRDAGLPVRDVAALTAFPEMLGGRVKTLHPMVHAGLLAVRDDAEHAAALEAYGIETIDLLVVNLYPFEATVAAGGDYAACVENIDIGGPAMLRSAAKNHRFVTVVTDVEDYAGAPRRARPQRRRHHPRLPPGAGADRLRPHRRLRRGGVGLARGGARGGGAAAAELRRHAGAAAALRREPAPGGRLLPRRQRPARGGDGAPAAGQGAQLQQHQRHRRRLRAGGRVRPRRRAGLRDHQAREPLRRRPRRPLLDAYRAAYDCDRTSAFGGIVALNGALDAETAAAIAEIFTEVVIAPEATPEAAAVFAAKKNLRLLVTGGLPDPRAPGLAWRQVAGGFLVQGRDNGRLALDGLRIVTRRAPSEPELADLRFAWTVAKHVKSNAIVYARGGATVGIGAGQMSRVDSTRIAARKAEDMAAALGLAEPPTRGAVVASDAFFPFPDGLLAAADAGATAVIQPGGSVRDEEVIAAADDAGLAMVFTGLRHFRH